MKKLMVCLCVLFIVSYPFKFVSADETSTGVDDIRLSAYLSRVYEKIDFSSSAVLPYDVFAKAYRGYLNLREAGRLNTDKQVISICDFSRASTEKRLWIIDLSTGKVLFNTYVAHGQGSGEDCAEAFSNNNNSHQSSLGFYVTGATYDGEHGLSLKLDGMDHGYNDAAMDRGIVVHGADYVSEKFIAGNDRLGRSWGCPSVPDELKEPIINTIKDSTCLFIYYPESKYLASSFWLNRKVSHLPEGAMYDEITMPKKTTAKEYTIRYITNGKVDSVRSYPAAN